MNNKTLAILIFTIILGITSCNERREQDKSETVNRSIDFKEEKIAILETLNNETKVPFQRDYEAWKEK